MMVLSKPSNIINHQLKILPLTFHLNPFTFKRKTGGAILIESLKCKRIHKPSLSRGFYIHRKNYRVLCGEKKPYRCCFSPATMFRYTRETEREAQEKQNEKQKRIRMRNRNRMST
jgi:hypothetical protein